MVVIQMWASNVKNNKLPLGRNPGQKLRFSYEFWEPDPQVQVPALHVHVFVCLWVSRQAAGTLPPGPICEERVAMLYPQRFSEDWRGSPHGTPPSGPDSHKCSTPGYSHSVQLLSRVWLFATPWTTAHQVFLSVTNSWSLLKLMSIQLVMPSNHLILCHPLLLLPSIFPSIRVFSNESAPHIWWPKDWRFSFNISPSNEYSGLISFRMDWLDLLAVQGTLKSFSNTTVQKHQFFGTQLS